MALHLLKPVLGNNGRSFCTSTLKMTINNVTVIGGGTMGAGIAQVAAASGNTVNLVDVSDSVLQKSRAAIEKSLARVAKKQFKDDPTKGEAYVSQALSKLQYITDSKKAVENADLVIEAIIEDLQPKIELFEKLDKLAPQKTIFASNTSSIPITEIASKCTRKDRFGGLHFFSPVPMMRLLEVIRISDTSDETYHKMDNWGKSIGKVTVTCKDTPGFIVNRLLIPYSIEAVRMVERGDATHQDVDTAMKLGAGYPMGPFELADSVGVDVGYYVAEGWSKRFPNDPLYKPSELVRKMVKEGKLGRKTGEGWYKYQK
ncbi:hydroxyacyl-coenzyme A dehydrogenase, mitochondrial [Folsomia candida]|uniref:3-hydroxyacyl-CoA dehydrogenase n=1 Tax=Folsomia candida TaxID=158441 RepID=A0A226EY83_FOLCA|nr:hydroxyacyl-coenzyme A dehydrogenase, mitochondrial [Folsomia candida]OXA62128.1 Hydroxyacyl-coenzyme A dehydrogenase, mitochondrial [Folsomia candida]